MSYIRSLLAHFRVLHDWAGRAGASAELDALSFELEIKCRGRYRVLQPQFLAERGGRLLNVPALSAEVLGFGGWLPYRPFPYPFARDKLEFKRHLAEAGLPTPRHLVLDEGGVPDFDHVLKRSVGSFGHDLAGPFRAGTAATLPPLPHSQRAGRLFAEQFVEGRILKVWYWGGRPFFAHLHEFPRLLGDGRRSARALAQRRLGGDGAEMPVVEACLAWQDVAPDDVLPEGARPFFDFRYGRGIAWVAGTTRSDDALASLAPPVREQLAPLGALVQRLLEPEVRVPVLYAADGMLDAQERIWWLEVNSNPALPPDGLRPMLDDLFDAGH